MADRGAEGGSDAAQGGDGGSTHFPLPQSLGRPVGRKWPGTGTGGLYPPATLLLCWRSKHHTGLGEVEFVRQRGHREAWRNQLLAEPRVQPGDVAIQQRIGDRRGVVSGCLDGPAAESTNNRAVRSLRDPGVIALQILCGYETEAGKTAWERLTSLVMTCRQRG